MPHRLICSLLLTLACIAHADELVLRDVMWQPLPDAVADVYVSPDQRIWRRITPRGGIATPELLKAMIAREFALKTPLLEGAYPILFEPSGRIWFSGSGPTRDLILGYDGKTWIERPAQKEHVRLSRAPNHAVDRPGFGVNLFIAGTCFFPDSYGVESFDGRDWSYQQFAFTKALGYHALALNVDVDGKGLVALLQGDSPILWRWRAGRWAQEASLPAAIQPVWAMAPARDGIWVETQRGLWFYRYDGAPRDEVKQQIAELRDANPLVRDKAAAALASGSIFTVAPLEQAVKDSAKDPAQVARLQGVLATLKKQNRNAGGPWPFGPYRLAAVSLLLTLPDHTICAVAGTAYEGERELGAAVVLLAPDGSARAVTDPQVIRALRTNPGIPADSPIAVDDHTLWVGPAAESPAALIDLKTWKVTHTLPDKGYRRRIAARADGTLFVAQAQRSTIMAYRLGQKEERRVLSAQSTTIAESCAAVASDGKVYALKPGGALGCFDGKGWTTTGLLQGSTHIEWALPGINGDVLIKADRDNFAFLGAGPSIVEKDLRAMIKQHRARFLKAYAPGARGKGSGAFRAILADKNENLWLLHDNHLNVLAGDRWLDADLLYRAAGSINGTVRYAATFGDSSKIFFAGFDSNRPDSQFAEVRDDKIVLTPAPPVSDPIITQRDLHAPDNALWLPAGWNHPGAKAAGRFLPTHLTHTKETTFEVLNLGWPYLVDLDGNVWFIERKIGATKQVSIWRDGKVIRDFPLTGISENVFELFADRPGSVWAWTSIGLQHFIAKDPAKPGQFDLEGAYSIESDMGQVLHVQYSSLGSVVVTAADSNDGHQRKLHIIQLPLTK